ncbi:hypothetical protein FCOIX_6246 [Fusarium coicis]|nr:hypothetical protein FCOIX_6246 [Fusarium coicis]
MITLADLFRRPGLYSCEPCLRKAMDWFPIESNVKKLPEMCIDEAGLLTKSQGTQLMGSLLERFIQHASGSLHLTKEEYDSDSKTIQLREMASRAIASYSNRSNADTMKDHRAEHERCVATNTLSTLIDISNSLRVIAQCTLHTSGLNRGITELIDMPPRWGPKEMPEECLWKFPVDENKDEEN